MSTVVTLPEKRNDLGQDRFPEPPTEKRAKLDDPQPGVVDHTAMELQSNSNFEESKSAEEAKSTEGAKSGEGSRPVFMAFCEICCGNVGHKKWDCPDRSTGMGLCCPSCHGPCKVKNGNPKDHWEIEMVKFCVQCGRKADHWVDDCPYWTEQLENESSLDDDDPVPF